ncbi:MAG TPA: aconitate hydratase, partial [Bryobacteraceae bacterium]
DIWPSNEEVQSTVRDSVNRGMFEHEYAHAFDGDVNWQTMPVPTGGTFQWDHQSTYIKKPPYFDHMVDPATSVTDFHEMRVLALLGDSVTTDHISPAGSIAKDGPAGRYLISQGVSPADFNSYGARRGNHEVMVRGTLANIRLRNQMAPGTEGGWTVHLPDGEQQSIYDASVEYQRDGVPLLILAGKEYGSGSSRDWAAKGVMLLGVRAVIAESFERIHRSNLVGMGVLPLQFPAGENAASLGLTGKEIFHIEGVRSSLNGGGRKATVRAVAEDGAEKTFVADVRVDTPQEVEYYRNGGILPYVLRQLAGV